MATTAPRADAPPKAARRKSGVNWTLLLVLVALGGAIGFAYVNPSTHHYISGVFRSAKKLGVPAPSNVSNAPGETTASAPERIKFNNTPWDRLIRLKATEVQAIGIRPFVVQKAEKATKLVLSGTTAYDPDSLIQVRVRFDSLVTRVRKTLGDPVAKGEALVELYSNQLAAAKVDYQEKYVQWLHDRRLYEQRWELYQKKAIAKAVWVDTENNEAQSWLDYQLAYDKLGVYGLSHEEITPLLNGLTEQSLGKLARDQESLAEKAKMALHSPANGIVIKRDVVPGNYYEPASVLMVIAPLDHLWVYANVYERDLELVHKDQVIDIEFPYQDRTITTKVQNIASQVDPLTHALRIRATITNPGDLKADMIVRAVVHIPPHQGDTWVPSDDVISTNNKYYVFVRKPEPAAPVSEAGKGKALATYVYERREIRIRQDVGDRMIVSDGLRAGEEIAANGSLLLAQKYEDLAIVDSGMPQ
jgi:cobalt-zinc-cadmium efflux system membrane fusion protein